MATILPEIKPKEPAIRSSFSTPSTSRLHGYRISETSRPQTDRSRPERFFFTGINYDRPPVYYDPVPLINTHREYSVYPSYLRDGTSIDQRVNVLRPSFARYTSTLETTDAHNQNRERSDLMKRRDHHRFHNAWSSYYYGGPGELEAHRRGIRETLKQQMADREESIMYERSSKVNESIAATSRDEHDITVDRERNREHRSQLLQYRDENKKMMEDLARRRREEHQVERMWEREILKYNPINWSGSLK